MSKVIKRVLFVKLEQMDEDRGFVTPYRIAHDGETVEVRYCQSEVEAIAWFDGFIQGASCDNIR